mgnify:CR=1 FL=1
MVERGSFRSAVWFCDRCGSKVKIDFMIVNGRRRAERIYCDCRQFPREEDINSGPR